MKVIIVAKTVHADDIYKIHEAVSHYILNFCEEINDMVIITNSLSQIEDITQYKEFVFNDNLIRTISEQSNEDCIIFYSNIDNAIIKNFDCIVIFEDNKITFSNKTIEEIEFENKLKDSINFILTHITFAMGDDNMNKKETISFLKNIINE